MINTKDYILDLSMPENEEAMYMLINIEIEKLKN